MSGSLTSTVNELFEEQASATPDAIAILFEGQEFTYRWLNEQANRLAFRLLQMGVIRGTIVGLCMDRCPEVIVAILGVLKAGGAYLPLDPTCPDDRLVLMIKDTASPIVLTHGPTASRMASLAENAKILCVDSNELANENSAEFDNPKTSATGNELIYVMYTSGSTGRPKGVLVKHRSVIRLVRNTNYCQFDSGEVFLLMAPLSFDASTFEIWGPLLNGARLVVYPPQVPALSDLAAVLQRYQVTTLWLTAGLFHLMVDHCPAALSTVRQLLAGGDVLSPTHVKKALAAMSNDGVLINGYGPTESTTFACCFPMSRNYQVEGRIPIGCPISNTTVYVMDEQHQPLSVGEPGELYIGGEGLAAGYLNDPELTRERFIPNPFDADGESRLYRTGDRVCILPDGNIEFLGRLDNQVKISGHRVEVGEVEAALLQIPGIRQAAVAASPLPSGEKQLVACIVVDHWRCSMAEEIRRQLSKSLPSYMIPVSITSKDQLPLTPNGKADRIALASSHQVMRPVSGRGGENGATIEEGLRAVWSRILQKDVGLDENFFDLGGSSLQLIEVHAEIARTLGRRINVIELFEHPTVRSCAGRLADNTDRVFVLDSSLQHANRQKEALARRKRIEVPGNG